MNTTVSFDLVNYLQNDSIFKGMSKELIQTLADAGRLKDYKMGECIFKQGEYANHFYIIKSGRVSVEIPSIYGPPLVVQKLDENNVLGWSWLIPPYQWAFEADAESELQVIEFDGKQLLAACEEDAKLGYELTKRFAALMSERLHEARETMMDNWSAPGFA